MKYALLTLLLGYLAVWQLENFRQYIIPLVVIFWVGFCFSVLSKRIEVLPKVADKLRAFAAILVGSLFLTLVIAFALYSQWIPLWSLPVILAILVLGRRGLKFLVNLTLREPRSYGISSETDRGEIVRSKSEKKVADWLYAHSYDYEYERKITLPDGSTILSDFYLPATDIYIEYWGLASADNEAGAKYRERKAEKIRLYNHYNYKLMDIYPHHLFELDQYIPKQIEELTRSKQGIFRRLRNLFGTRKSSSATIFCTNCGREITQAGDFCVKCGTQAI